MKLTILTGPQGSGKTEYLKLKSNAFTMQYSSSRLTQYPLPLLQFDSSIKTIVFDEVEELADFYRVAAIMAENTLYYKKTVPGITCSINNVEILIATQIPKKQLQHIFKGLPNVSFKEFGKPKKAFIKLSNSNKGKGYTEFTLPEEIKNQLVQND